MCNFPSFLLLLSVLPFLGSVLSVAHEEEEEAIIRPSSPVPPKPQNHPTTAVKHIEPAPPECSSVKESSSHSSTSITETETETETAGKHISEGELLLSCGQMAAVRGTRQPVRDLCLTHAHTHTSRVCLGA